MKINIPALPLRVLALATTLVFLAGAMLRAADQNDQTLLARLKQSKHSLAAGVAQSEK